MNDSLLPFTTSKSAPGIKFETLRFVWQPKSGTLMTGGRREPATWIFWLGVVGLGGFAETVSVAVRTELGHEAL